MVNDKGTQQETVTLPIQVIEFIEGLAKVGLYGTKKGEIYRYFITEGMHATVRDDVLTKHLAARDLLAGIGGRSDSNDSK